MLHFKMSKNDQNYVVNLENNFDRVKIMIL